MRYTPMSYLQFDNDVIKGLARGLLEHDGVYPYATVKLDGGHLVELASDIISYREYLGDGRHTVVSVGISDLPHFQQRILRVAFLIWMQKSDGFISLPLPSGKPGAGEA